MAKTIPALIGMPTDLGASRRGCSMGPEALRVAGIHTVLQRLCGRGVDMGDIKGPKATGEVFSNGYRHFDTAVAWFRTLSERVYETLSAGQCPVVLGGDHSIAIGSVSGVARYCRERDIPLTILWLDAHADFNTPATSPSGNLHGMPVALLTDPDSEMLRTMGPGNAAVAVDSFQLIGVRSIDRIEKQAVLTAGLEIYDMRRIDETGMRAVMDEVLDKVKARGGHLHVSFDIDFLDPLIAPGTGTQVKGGPDYREAQLCMEMIYDTGLFGSLDLVEINPALDIRNQTAEIAVEMTASLFGEQILARHGGSKR